jgi:hypothetical protein
VKLIGLMSATGLLLLLGCAASANGKQEPQEKQEKQDKQEKQEQAAKPSKHEEQAKPEKRQDQARGQEQQRQQPDKSRKQQQREQAQGQQDHQQQQQDKSAKQEQKEQARGQQEQEQQQHQQQARPSQPPQRTQQAEARQRAQPELRLTARGGGRISDDRFRSHFGREHTFRVGNPVLVGGYSRFQYGGYWFGFVEPWPSGWYYTDDVYIDYVDDGYYMYDPYYPGTRFAISVVL